MSRTRIAIVSDIHYAGPREAARKDHVFAAISNPYRRWAVRQYRHWIWMRDPFAHNHLLDRFCAEASSADLAVANGDYSCDSAYIGLADEAAFESARECLSKLRQTFGTRLRTVMGDHEIGKKMLAADTGGLRLESYDRATSDLAVETFWKEEIGNYVLLGIASTLVAFPIYEAEALPEEKGRWHELRARHLNSIAAAFESLRAHQRVLLFCHDPTALPFLAELESVRARLPQIERTVLGHLHSDFVFRRSRQLAGMPRIRGCGHTVLRLSSALRQARHWKQFRPLLCPSIAGIQLFKDGGYYTAELELEADRPVEFTFHPLPW